MPGSMVHFSTSAIARFRRSQICIKRQSAFRSSHGLAERAKPRLRTDDRPTWIKLRENSSSVLLIVSFILVKQAVRMTIFQQILISTLRRGQATAEKKTASRRLARMQGISTVLNIPSTSIFPSTTKLFALLALNLPHRRHRKTNSDFPSASHTWGISCPLMFSTVFLSAEMRSETV